MPSVKSFYPSLKHKAVGNHLAEALNAHSNNHFGKKLAATLIRKRFECFFKIQSQSGFWTT
jgi:hypothetical protein